MLFFTWLAENIATVLICAGLVGLVAAIVFSLIRDRRQGKTSCGCNCAGCAMSGSCHSKKK